MENKKSPIAKFFAIKGMRASLIAFIGIAIALGDFQTRVAIKAASGNASSNTQGGEEDGI